MREIILRLMNAASYYRQAHGLSRVSMLSRRSKLQFWRRGCDEAQALELARQNSETELCEALYKAGIIYCTWDGYLDEGAGI